MAGEGYLNGPGTRFSPTDLGALIKSGAAFLGVEGKPLPTDPPRDLEAAANLRNVLTQNSKAQERWLSEVNFQRLPFALLWDKKAGSKEPIAVEQSYLRDGARVLRRWQVLPGTLGIPGPTAYETFRALEKVLLSRTLGRGIPLANPQGFEIQEICKALGLALKDHTYARIKQDLRRIRDCTFIDDGMLREKRQRKTRASAKKAKTRVELRFSLIDALTFRYDQDIDGKIALTNRIRFGDVYLESVNSGYIKPLDWAIWAGLERPIAKRLYELIDLKLFSIPGASAIDFDYDDLVQLLPMTRRPFLSQAAQTLQGPLEELRPKVVSGYDWHEDGSVWSLIVKPADGYRKSLHERLVPTIDVRAQEVAMELRDVTNIAFYQRVVTSVDRLYVDIALSETRMAVNSGSKGISKPGAYFTEVLGGLLKRRGLPVPFAASNHVATK